MSLEEFLKTINIYSLPAFFAGLTFLGVGLFVWLKNKTERKNVAFLFISAVSSLWLIGFSLGFSAKDQTTAALLFKISYSFVMFIAISVTHFVALFLNYEKRIRSLLVFGYIFFGFASAINISTSLAVKGIYKYFWGFYPNLNTPFDALFLAVFMGYVIFTIFLALTSLLKNQKNLSDTELKRRKFVLVGLILYSIACVDFIPGYGIEIYPFGYIPALIFAILISYAVFRYGAFEAEKVLRQKEIFEAFKRGENRYMELIENTPLCIKVFDGQGNLLFLNKGGREEHFLKDTDDISKWNWLGTVKEQHRTKARELFEKALKGESSVVEFEHTPEGSKHKWCSGIISPIKGKDGKVQSVLFYSNDITALKRAELEAKENEKMFKTLLDAAPLCIKWFDSKGNLISINRGGREEHHLENLNEEEIKKWDYMSCIDEQYRQVVKEKMNLALKGESSSFEMKHTKGCSTGEWCYSVLTPVKGANEEIEFILFLSRDITGEKERKEKERENLKKLEETKIALFNILEDVKESENNLKEEHDRSTAIIQSMGEGLLVLDDQLKIVLINAVAEKLLGASSEKAIGVNWRDLVTVYNGEEEIPREKCVVLEVVDKNKAVSFGLENNIYYENSLDRKFPVTMMITPLRVNEKNHAVIIFNDVSKEKALDEARTSFISIASHQLRTPLTSIRWYAELLDSEETGKLNDQQKDFISRVYGGALRLNEIINLMLTLSRIESGKLEVEKTRVDLIEFTKNLIKDLEALISQKEIRVAFIPPKDKLPQIDFDASILRQIVTNLLSNSIRYTDLKGNIEINVEKTKDEIIYSVKDDGIGIPRQYQDKIFTKFFRAENAVSKIPDGSGLGLSLVKTLVEMNKGRIWFESPATWIKEERGKRKEEKKGTVFYFTIPI